MTKVGFLALAVTVLLFAVEFVPSAEANDDLRQMMVQIALKSAMNSLTKSMKDLPKELNLVSSDAMRDALSMIGLSKGLFTASPNKGHTRKKRSVREVAKTVMDFLP